MTVTDAVSFMNAELSTPTVVEYVGEHPTITTQGLDVSCQPTDVVNVWRATVPVGDYMGRQGLIEMIEAATGASGVVLTAGGKLDRMGWEVREPTALVTVLTAVVPAGFDDALVVGGLFNLIHNRAILLTRSESAVYVEQGGDKRHQDFIVAERYAIEHCRLQMAFGQEDNVLCDEATLRFKEWEIEVIRRNPSIFYAPLVEGRALIDGPPEDFEATIGISEPAWPVPRGYWED